MCSVSSKLIFDADNGKKFKETCNNCKNITNHEVLRSVKNDWDDYDDDAKAYGVYGYEIYQIIKCNGCDTFSFRTVEYFSESDGISVTIFPDRFQDHRDSKIFEYTPINISRIYSETITAFNNKSYILCSAGLRSIVEGICQDKNIKSGTVKHTDKSGNTKEKESSTLEGKISGLQEQNHLTASHANILHALRFLGNDALHELKPPSKKELDLALEIIESTIEHMYELPNKADELSKQTEKRKKRLP